MSTVACTPSAREDVCVCVRQHKTFRVATSRAKQENQSQPEWSPVLGRRKNEDTERETEKGTGDGENSKIKRHNTMQKEEQFLA